MRSRRWWEKVVCEKVSTPLLRLVPPAALAAIEIVPNACDNS